MFYLFERYCPFCGKREAATATPPAEQGADEAAPALIYGGRQYGPEREKES